MAKKTAATVKIQYYRSSIGRPQRHKEIVRGLGLRRLNQVVERPDIPAVRGMVNRVPHLVRIIEGEEK